MNKDRNIVFDDMPLDDFIKLMEAYDILCKVRPKQFSSKLDDFYDWLIKNNIGQEGITTEDIDNLMKTSSQ
jgi:hypothetical protein